MSRNIENDLTIDVPNSVLLINSNFDPLKNIKAYDKFRNDITNNLEVFVNEVDTNKVGSYKVTYIVEDDYKNSCEKTINVSVVECNDSIYYALTQYIAAVSLTQTALSVILEAEMKKIEEVTQNTVNHEDLINVTESSSNLVISITKLEIILRNKIETLM